MTDHRESADTDAEDSARERRTRVQVQNDRGEWVPAIPLPEFLGFGRVRCSCGEVRRDMRSYREHYALAHILGLS